MYGLLESVPNFSEGRDRTILEAIRAAMANAGARVLDIHSDEDHNRSVFTVVADPDGLVEALAAGIAVAVGRIDLREHEGVHPRVGAADVVPIVRFAPDDDRPERAARLLGRRIALLGVPVVPYGALADGTRPASYRQGGIERLTERMNAGEVTPLFGPASPHPSAGVVLLGVRSPLVALNVDLESDDVELARSIAAQVRERDGGLPGVQALGLRTSKGAQVSTNLIDIDATPLHVLVSEIERLASEAGAGIRGSELVGLMPARAAAQAAGSALRLPGMSADRTLEVATAGEFGTQV
ncbi:MAG: glutamate formiminotransferase / 5-formyltetrahydrofolate cyclo-ligase [Gaiellales bacterium]|jgi:glutamate formiminotransferase|nr:glutamate formiminotransferase / 5-formyltetrahydrofolate cyclo-ligase [Gaiellales bacterium]